MTFRVESPDAGRIRALLEADRAYNRVRDLRRFGVTALAVAGCAAWLTWSARADAARRLVLATWSTLLLFTVIAILAEIRAWRRLQRAVRERNY